VLSGILCNLLHVYTGEREKTLAIAHVSDRLRLTSVVSDKPLVAWGAEGLAREPTLSLDKGVNI